MTYQTYAGDTRWIFVWACWGAGIVLIHYHIIHFSWSNNISYTGDHDLFLNYFVVCPQVRFLLRSGREYDHVSSESDKLSPRFLGYFLFRSSERKQSLDKRFVHILVNCFSVALALMLPTILTSNFLWISTSFKEQSAHITSVKNILESHASYLMSGKELSKLVAFVKGTQFDLVVTKSCQLIPFW